MTEELLAYKRMPLWTAETMPEAVKRKHNTKEGTWGKITVLKGRLKFVEMSRRVRSWLSTSLRLVRTILLPSPKLGIGSKL